MTYKELKIGGLYIFTSGGCGRAMAFRRLNRDDSYHYVECNVPFVYCGVKENYPRKTVCEVYLLFKDRLEALEIMPDADGFANC